MKDKTTSPLVQSGKLNEPITRRAKGLTTKNKLIAWKDNACVVIANIFLRMLSPVPRKGLENIIEYGELCAPRVNEKTVFGYGQVVAGTFDGDFTEMNPFSPFATYLVIRLDDPNAPIANRKVYVAPLPTKAN